MNWKKPVFMGSPWFSVPTLDTLYHHFGKAVTVVTRPDMATGRGQRITPTPVKSWATKHDLPVFQPENKQALSNTITTLSPDLIIVLAYGMILPKSITDTVPCLNLHASLLPKYRGASPIQASLLANDQETGITLIRMNEKMDEGPILDIMRTKIETHDNFQTLSEKLATLAAETLDRFLTTSRTLSKIDPGTPQNHAESSYCTKLSREDAKINPNDPPEKQLAVIRAFAPKPGAYLLKNNKRIQILAASIKNNALVPEVVKPEGKAAMSYQNYRLGHPEGL